MTEYAARRNLGRCPSHPGAVLLDMIPATGLTKSELASRLGISRQQFHDILAEKKPVSPAVAVRLGKLFGGGTVLWVRIQAAHDAWHADREVDVSGIEPLAA